METYQELKLKSKKPEEVEILMKRVIAKAIKASWEIKNDFIDNYKKNMIEKNKQIICVLSPKIQLNVGEETQGYVWFGEWKDFLEVFNIVPVNSGGLSYSEYNKILKLFYDELILSEIKDLHFELTYTKPLKSIKEIAGEEVGDALKTFSNIANRATGNSHPMDSERWKRFVCLAYKLKSELGVEDLVRWLKEDEGWSDEIAWELGLDYEYSLDLLKYYDENFNS